MINRRKISLKIVVIILIASTTITVWSLMSKGKESPPLVQPCKDDLSKTSSTSDPRILFYENYNTLILPNDGLTIDSKTLIQDIQLNKQPIAKLKNQGYTLIFRYSYSDCEMCIQSTLKSLNNEFKGDKDKLIIITDSYSERDFMIKTKHTESKLPIYNILDGYKGLGMPLEGKNLPFLFVLNSENKVSKVFIPYKEYPKKTSEYLQSMHQFINNTK